MFSEGKTTVVERGVPAATIEGLKARGAPIESAIDELSGWYCFSDKYLKARAKERASASALPGFFGDTFERERPKVGRNDPCPCGSGRKSKKCCLQ